MLIKRSMRTCKICHTLKEITEFHGRRVQCRDCVNKALRTRYAEDEAFRTYKLNHGSLWRGKVAGARECRHCFKTQEASQFYGPRRMCKSCFAAWGREKRALPGARRSNKSTALQKRFGIDLTEYERMLREAGGVCEICKKVDSTGRMLAVDHDHSTASIRGLLCSMCNRALGQFRDSVDTLRAAITYLERAR